MGKWCRQHRSGAKRDHVTTLINRLLRLTRTQHIIAQCRASVGCFIMLREGMPGSGKRASRWGGLSDILWITSSHFPFFCLLTECHVASMKCIAPCADAHLEARP